jgi:hypothetical protein
MPTLPEVLPQEPFACPDALVTRTVGAGDAGQVDVLPSDAMS